MLWNTITHFVDVNVSLCRAELNFSWLFHMIKMALVFKILLLGKQRTFDTVNTMATGEITHWSRVTHICVGKPTIIGSGNGLSPDRRQAIIWTNAGIT